MVYACYLRLAHQAALCWDLIGPTDILKGILAEGAIALSVTLSGGALFAS